MIKMHVFDIDGTVLDSMRMWDQIAFTYLEGLGINAPENLAKIIDPMPVPEIKEYLAERFSISGGADAVEKGMLELLRYQYTHEVMPFSDAMRELEEIQNKGERMVAFSNTPHALLDIAISKYDLNRYFETVYCVEDIGLRKDNPAAFSRLSRLLGVAPEHILVHDDSDFALDAARCAGCRIKVYDRYR